MLNGQFTAIPELNSQPANVSDAIAALTQIGQAPPSGDGYYTDSGDDLVIWTYHFTTFVAYTESTVSPGGSGGGGGAPPALAVTTTSLPAGTAGQSCSGTINTNGEGTKPYTFSVTSGTLPPGLTLDTRRGWSAARRRRREPMPSP